MGLRFEGEIISATTETVQGRPDNPTTGAKGFDSFTAVRIQVLDHDGAYTFRGGRDLSGDDLRALMEAPRLSPVVLVVSLFKGALYVDAVASCAAPAK